MAGPRAVGWRAAAALAVVLTAVALGGCGTKADKQGTGRPGEAQVGGAPTATAGGAGPTAGATGKPAAVAPAYPADARAYAQELLKAWAGPDYTRLGQLAIRSAVQQIRDSITFGGKPNSQWTYISCRAGEQVELIDCVFRNAHGDETTITLTKAQLGFPTAVRAAQLIRTEYPNDPASYVGALLSALDGGNQQRVLRLSSSAVASGLTCPIGFRSVGAEAIDATYAKVTVTGLAEDGGKMYVFRVLAQPGDKAGAVKEILSESC